MKALKNNVLVRISEAERRKIFEKPITRDDGTVVNLVVAIKADLGFDAAYSQTVPVGEVVMTGKDVKEVNVGDLVLLDYIVDALPDIIVSRNDEEKIVCISSISEFYDKTFIIDANRRTPHPTVVYNKGDMKTASLIIAAIQDGVINPVWPYTMLEHVQPKSEFEMKGNFFQDTPEEEGMVERTVLIPNKQSEFKAGQRITCDVSHLYYRELDGKRFDVIFDSDIAGVIN